MIVSNQVKYIFLFSFEIRIIDYFISIENFKIFITAILD